MTTREDAVKYAMSVIKSSTDWQEVQEAMANDARIRAWIDEQSENDMVQLTICQSVIRDAEERLGDKLPPDYA